jgi:hypothetical protein
MTEPEYGSPEYWAQQRPDTAAVIRGDAVMSTGSGTSGLIGWPRA